MLNTLYIIISCVVIKFILLQMLVDYSSSLSKNLKYIEFQNKIKSAR